jgi:hypothetical protein
MRALLLICVAACGANRSLPDDGTDAGPACFPDLDGQLDAAELPSRPGITARYRQGTDRAIDLITQPWDFGGAADDAIGELGPIPVTGRWYAADFPAGELAVSSDGIDTILRQDEAALWLLGLASTEPDPSEGRTLLIYEDPIALIRFPLSPGMSWTSSSPVSGTLRGLPYQGMDRYDVAAAAMGELVLPELVFEQAHRVDTLVTVTPAVGQATTRRQAGFYAECAGEVVRATSAPGETVEDFTNAAELRRLAL